MENRKRILEKLINLDDNLEDLSSKLSRFKWDTEVPIITMTNLNFIYIINKIINDDNNFEKLEILANIIECRDDIDFENERLNELIFEFANPLIYGEITSEKLQNVLNELRKMSS